MTSRPLLLLVLLSPGVVLAGEWDADNPDLVGRPVQSAVRVHGLATSVRLANRAGTQIVVKLPRPQRLDAAFRLPPGAWTDLTLVLDGPVWVTVDGATVALELPSITVALDDPQASAVQLDWRLPAGAAGLDSAALGAALADGALALPQR